jgi:HSP20 family protein
MNLHRYPTQAARLLRGDLSNLFDGFLDEPFFAARPTAWPALNVWEEGDHLFAEAELPGMKMEELDVSVMGRQLTIKGQRAAGPNVNFTYHRRERGVGDFARTITLPVEIDSAAVEATLKDGVLTIKLPKAPEARPRKIDVRTA